MVDTRAAVHVALVGGPMYDPLYDGLSDFEKETGYCVQIVARLPHPELNAFVKRAFDTGSPRLDLISTHTKYAPSQAGWLAPLDGLLPPDVESDLLPRPRELSCIGGRLLQVPRNLDVRLLHYRRDLFEDPCKQDAFVRGHGRPLEVPRTWSELAEVATFFTQPGFHGFLFPGRDSGLFGTFYEMLVGAGGELFDDTLRPAFASPAGEWAAGMIADLHCRRKVTPRELSSWHYDEISAAFRAGTAAMVCDWPGSYHLYRDPATCVVADSVGLAPLPAGSAGIRAAYAGCHSFAIPRTTGNRRGAAALLRWLTSLDAQLTEGRRGAIPCRASALARIREEAAANPSDARRWGLLADAEQTMIIPPRFAAYPICEDAIWRSIQDAMEGRLTPADAVRSAAESIRPIVSLQAAAQ